MYLGTVCGVFRCMTLILEHMSRCNRWTRVPGVSRSVQSEASREGIKNNTFLAAANIMCLFYFNGGGTSIEHRMDRSIRERGSERPKQSCCVGPSSSSVQHSCSLQLQEAKPSLDLHRSPSCSVQRGYSARRCWRMTASVSFGCNAAKGSELDRVWMRYESVGTWQSGVG